MQQPLSATRISHALFATDPMHTCCIENQCFDEYDRVAMSASEHLRNGCSLSQALRKALLEWFGDEQVEGRDLSQVCAELQQGMNSNASEA